MQREDMFCGAEENMQFVSRNRPNIVQTKYI